jgi:hypothetical protein
MVGSIGCVGVGGAARLVVLADPARFVVRLPIAGLLSAE